MLTLFNTLTQKKETFTSLVNKRVELYVCGITPYDTTHLGHAFTYIAFDLLVRFLSYSGYSVVYTQNVTDINDRDNDILKRAKEQQISWNKLAQFWTERFLSDMKALHWIPPTNYLKASEQIVTITNLIEEIIKNGYGYHVKGGVYLDITKKNDFGKLSRLSQDEMMVKAKAFEEDLNNPNKRHPLDITLWRPSMPDQPTHIPSFDSPWGKGRPGWHIECSAMSISSLSDQIDIHGGGTDLIYPHHESEIAQSEAATGKKPFSRFWLHTGTMRIGGEKMSKSLGNLILVSDLLKKYSAHAIRWVLLSHHYREPWDYDEEEFSRAEETLAHIHKVISKRQDKNEKTHHQSDFKTAVTSYLENDLDSPKVLEALQNAVVILDKKYNWQLQQDIKEVLKITGCIIY